MKRRFQLSFRLTELLLLAFELNLAVAGMLMIAAAWRGNTGGLYLPGEALLAVLPAGLLVGFSAWLVYRLRCVSRIQHRATGLLAAVGLGIVAISFGAAVGKLSMVFSTDRFETVVAAISRDPVTREAGLTGLLAFTLIGLVFGVTFVLRAGRSGQVSKPTLESLHVQIQELSRQVVSNWPDRLVHRVDQLVAADRIAAAEQLYQSETACSPDTASQVIADWPEQRLRLEVELLSECLPGANHSGGTPAVAQPGSPATL